MENWLGVVFLSLSREEKERFIKALEEDREFRYSVMGLIGFREVIERITRVEERLARVEERQQLLEERFVKLEERFAKLEERFQKLEERYQKLEERMVRVEKLVTTIGERFGVITEKSFREALSGILTKYFGVQVGKWSVFDDEGIVFGYPTVIDVDVVVRDETHILVEIKSRVDPEDVYKLYRVGRLYERKTGVKPKLAIVAGYVTPKAVEASEKLGVEIYSYLEEEKH